MAHSDDEEEEILAPALLPTPGVLGSGPTTHDTNLQVGVVGHDVGVQTEAHVFIANFIHDANDEQLVAASGALSAIDFNRLAAA